MSGANENVKKADFWRGMSIIIFGCFSTAMTMGWIAASWCARVDAKLVSLEEAVRDIRLVNHESQKNTAQAKPFREPKVIIN